MRSAADCLPRLSPPAASPACMALIRRSASGCPALAAKASAVASITRGPASMLPATLTSCCSRWPHQSTHALPVWAAPGPWAGSTCNWRWAWPASASASALTTAAAERPCAKSASPCGPYKGFIKAWVAIAPDPARVWMHREPTEKNRLAMATPKRPSGSRTKIDQVMGRMVEAPWSGACLG